MLRPLGPELGAELRRRHEARGVRFRLGRTVARFTETGLELSDGSAVRADVVVEAVGSVPCVEWLEGNGLDLSDGVLCDGALRVEGRPDAVAVGDVARFPNPRYDDVPRRVEHWSIPTDTARHAARSLLGEESGAFMPLPRSGATSTTCGSSRSGRRASAAATSACWKATSAARRSWDTTATAGWSAW